MAAILCRIYRINKKLMINNINSIFINKARILDIISLMAKLMATLLGRIWSARGP